MTIEHDPPADDSQLARGQASEETGPTVDFPTSKTPPDLTVLRQKEFYGWVGSADRIARIGKLVEDASRRAFEDTRAKLEAIENEYSRQSRVEEFQVTAEVFGAHNMHRKGGLEAVLAEMDPADITHLAVENHCQSAHASVRLGRRYLYDEVALIRVSGSDPQWVAGTFEQLVSEVSKDVPAWAGFRKHAVTVGASLFALVTFVAVRIALQGVTFVDQGQRLPSNAEAVYRALFAFAASVLGGGIGAGIFALVRRWALVPFEVLEPGQKSTARRIGGGIVGVIATVAALIAIGSSAVALFH